MKKLILIFSTVALSSAVWGQNVTPAMKASNDLAVVVNTKNTTTAISSSELGLILRGERQFWGSKAPVQLILLPPGTREFDEPIEQLLKMKPHEFREYWKAKVFRGETRSEPTYVPSSGMAAQFSRDAAGAVTLLAARDLPADAKVLKVDGKYPGDPGYPLR